MGLKNAFRSRWGTAKDCPIKRQSATDTSKNWATAALLFFACYKARSAGSWFSHRGTARTNPLPVWETLMKVEVLPVASVVMVVTRRQLGMPRDSVNCRSNLEFGGANAFIESCPLVPLDIARLQSMALASLIIVTRAGELMKLCARLLTTTL